MTKFGRSLIACSALALAGTWACSSPAPRGGGGTGGEEETGGSPGTGGSKATGGTGGGKATGGAPGTGGSTGGSGGATGGSGGSTGGTGGGGSGGGGSTGADAGTDGPPSSGGKFTITVDGEMMGTRLCFKPEASSSGGNKSPLITWTNPPAGTMSYVLSMYDQSNKTPHRIVCNIPPTETMQAANIGTMLPMGAEAGTGHTKPGDPWYGPGAPHPAHSYEIAIWALSTPMLEGGCKGDGGTATNAVLAKLKAGIGTLVLATDSKVLWGAADGKCTP
jgi:phosphatidylethanolamine-binding protein (PEBP) family uncharacterized protein